MTHESTGAPRPAREGGPGRDHARGAHAMRDGARTTGGRPGRRRGPLSVIGLGAVGVIAGLLFSTSASLASDEPDRRPENLRDLVRDETARLEETRTTVLGLRDDVDALLEQSRPVEMDPGLALAAGQTAVAGPGVVVQLWDAPTSGTMPDGVTPDDLVVHQQDLEGVMNALWAGGAEAMTVQGHRVTGTTSVRCVGNVLLIDGATYSPPYEISAIGSRTALQESLLASPAVDLYLQYVDALNLGWSLTEQDEIEMPADRSNLTLEHAHVPG